MASSFNRSRRRRSQKRARPSEVAQPWRIHRPGDAKVTHHGAVRAVWASHQENIGALEIPVDNALGMGRLERVGHLPRQLQRHRKRHGSDVPDALGECFARQQLHGEEDTRLATATHVEEVEEATDVGGWVMRRARTTSRRRRSTAAGEAASSGRINLRATEPPNSSSIASMTSPMPPWARVRTTRKRSASNSPGSTDPVAAPACGALGGDGGLLPPRWGGAGFFSHLAMTVLQGAPCCPRGAWGKGALQWCESHLTPDRRGAAPWAPL
jgi:hypothetical protein